MNGFEACRRIRERERGQGVTLVAVTGWGQDEHKQQSKDVGFDGHLVKPVNLDALKKVLALPPSASFKA